MSHNGLVSNNHKKINHYARVCRPEKAKERKHDTWDTSSVSKYQFLHIYDPSTFQNGRNILFLKLWLAPDKGKTWQRHTNKQEIEWEVDINASVNEQSYKNFHCIVPREKTNPELSKEKLKFHAGSKAV